MSVSDERKIRTLHAHFNFQSTYPEIKHNVFFFTSIKHSKNWMSWLIFSRDGDGGCIFWQMATETAFFDRWRWKLHFFFWEIATEVAFFERCRRRLYFLTATNAVFFIYLLLFFWLVATKPHFFDRRWRRLEFLTDSDGGCIFLTDGHGSSI